MTGHAQSRTNICWVGDIRAPLSAFAHWQESAVNSRVTAPTSSCDWRESKAPTRKKASQEERESDPTSGIQGTA
ncbi:hypothetical protein V492_05305 [Pseudogymnoascus sp. VKM F-4246]|nr:hypothetical protein V492_05305 [Pseudogymnoascus sp. VKM F-4246]